MESRKIYWCLYWDRDISGCKGCVLHNHSTKCSECSHRKYMGKSDEQAIGAIMTPINPDNVQWDTRAWLNCTKSLPLVLDNSEETGKFKASLDLDNCRWMILDEEKAKELHIDIIKIDENHVIISADIAFIPDGVSIEEYYNYLQETGILINNKTLKEKIV